MEKKLYVGNLSYNTTENELQDVFSEAGEVQEVLLVLDKMTGKSRGFAFITMQTEEGAGAAIEKINGRSVDGRSLKVSEARPRESRPPREDSGGGRGGGRRGPGGGGRGNFGGRREHRGDY